MKLSQVTLVVLLTVGSVSALKCNTCNMKSCRSDQFRECEAGEMCMIKEQMQRHGPYTEEDRLFKRGCMKDCTNVSVDLGSIFININCCSSDFCNQETEQASSTLQCHGCLETGDDFQCKQPGSVRCQSTQDKCAEIHASLPSDPGRTVTLRGCTSASFCSPDRVFETIDVQGNISCCDHNLCNGSGPTATLTPLRPTLLLLLLLGLISL